jgi:NDP-sugar pyrophosphorylase family protein
MFKKAVIIAGGLGSRMRPLTDYVPKPLVKVNDVPLINYVLNFLESNNICDICVTYGYKSNLLTNHIGNKISSLLNTIGKDNSYFLFNSLIKYVDEPIIVCPCDMIVKLDLNDLYNEYIALNSPAACIVPIETDLDADSIISENNRILSISRGSKSKKYASGIQILNPKMINDSIQPFDNFYNVWNALIEKNMLYTTNLMPSEWKIFDKLNDLP